jgi:predicted HTH domain antitoxin
MPPLACFSEFDIKMLLAAKLYEERKLALGYCAEMAGLSKRAFIELLGKYGVSLFSQTAVELQSDIDNASKLFR